MNRSFYIGCSGFYYKEWKNTFYPPRLPQAKWFEYYCTKFNTLELNVTFYRFPQLRMLQSWHNRSPQDFIFSVKVPRQITHYKQFRDAQKDIAEFYSTIRFGLAEKLGPVLFQLPPQFAYSEHNLAQIISHAHPEFINVIEFRHPSWWQAEVWKQLEAQNIIFCGISYPNLPDEPIINNQIAYYRFHGVPQLYHSAYDEKFLTQVVQQTNTATQTFLYFNNTASGAALHNAAFVQQATGASPEIA